VELQQLPLHGAVLALLLRPSTTIDCCWSMVVVPVGYCNFPMPPSEMAAPIPRHLVYIQKRIPWHYCDAVAINCLHCEWMAEQCHCCCFPILLLQLLQVNCCFMFVILGNKAWPGAALKTAAMMPPLHHDAVEETCLQPKGFPLQCHLQ